jgi:hypothetical protein
VSIASDKGNVNVQLVVSPVAPATIASAAQPVAVAPVVNGAH